MRLIINLIYQLQVFVNETITVVVNAVLNFFIKSPITVIVQAISRNNVGLFALVNDICLDEQRQY